MTGREFSECRLRYDQMLVMVDGEYYIQSIPTYDMMTRLQSWAYCSEAGFSGMEIDCFVYHMKNNGHRRYVASPYSRLLSKSEMCAPREVHCGWRPMLVPLDQHGHLSGCLKNVRNGTIVRGGTFSYGETFCGHTTADFSDGISGHPVLTTVFPDVEIEISDSCADPDKSIPWIIWDGKLVCSRVLIGDVRVDTLYSRNGCFPPSLASKRDLEVIEK